jgi:ribosomal protein S18 acetylase RimI-like enzyme
MSSTSFIVKRTITPFTKTDVPKAIEVMVKAFAYDSPYSWARAFGRPAEGFQSYMNYMVPNYADKTTSPLSFVGKINDTVQGLILLDDLVHEQQNNQREDNDALDPITSILHTGEQFFWDYLAITMTNKSTLDTMKQQRGKYLYVGWIAVMPDCGKQGLGGALIEEAKEEARRTKFEYAVALCISPMAANLFRKHGFLCIGAVNYETFKVGSDNPFKTIPDDMRTMIWKVL